MDQALENKESRYRLLARLHAQITIEIDQFAFMRTALVNELSEADALRLLGDLQR